MKKQIFYLLMAVLGTVGLNSCGPMTGTNDTNRDGTATPTATGTTSGTTGDMSGTTTGDRTGTTMDTQGNNQTTTVESGNTTGTTRNQTATTTGRTGDQMGTTQRQEPYRLDRTTDYTYNNENYRFSPDQRGGIEVTRNQDGQETPYGTMRSIGDEGYFIITTITATGDEEMSVGRFDEQGNFTRYRYDRDRDDVTEENFRTTNPISGQNNGTIDNNRNE